MADNVPAPTGEGSPTPAAPATPAAPTTGTEPAKPASGTQAFDSTKLSDEDFTKIFSDPRLFTHDRFKTLNEKAKEADKLQKERETAENAQLEKDKKWEELAKKHQDSVKDWQGKYETSLINNKIAAEAIKLGITDIEAATKLIETGKISIDSEGNVVGVEDAVKALAESKPYLVDKSKQVPTVGSPSNPSGANQTQGSHRQFKASEIADPVFYREHVKDIDASMQAGVPIIDDRPGN